VLGDCFVARQDARDGEEAGLHDRVDAPSHAGLARDLVGVDHEQTQPLIDELLLHLARQLIPDLARRVGRVQQNDRSRGGVLEDVVAVEKAELVAGDEAGPPDEVRGADRARPEAQMRDRDGA